jgi:hypothetical protein
MKYLDNELEPAAAARSSQAIATMIKLRTIRHGLEHGDARAKAVAAYAELGITFPVTYWPQAWTQVSALVRGALDVLREEAHAGLRNAGINGTQGQRGDGSATRRSFVRCETVTLQRCGVIKFRRPGLLMARERRIGSTARKYSSRGHREWFPMTLVGFSLAPVAITDRTAPDGMQEFAVAPLPS